MEACTIVSKMSSQMLFSFISIKLLACEYICWVMLVLLSVIQNEYKISLCTSTKVCHGDISLSKSCTYGQQQRFSNSCTNQMLKCPLFLMRIFVCVIVAMELMNFYVPYSPWLLYCYVYLYNCSDANVGITNDINITHPNQTTAGRRKSQTTCDALYTIPVAVGFVVDAVNREKWCPIARITHLIE